MNNTEESTHYDTLQVSPTATASEIRKAYYKLSLKYHPDKNPNNAEEAKEIFVHIGQAYSVLSDEVQRKQYDRDLACGRAAHRVNYNRPSSGHASTNATNAQTNEGEYEYEYEFYKQAFDDRMAGLSEEDLSKLKNVASVVGAFVGSVIASKMSTKLGGKSKVGRAIGETAGSMMGSMVGSQAGTQLVSSVHTSSVNRVMYEEQKRVAKERGEPLPKKPESSTNWNDLKSTFEQTMNSRNQQQTNSHGNDRSRDNGNISSSDNDGGTDWVKTGMSILGAFAAAKRSS